MILNNPVALMVVRLICGWTHYRRCFRALVVHVSLIPPGGRSLGFFEPRDHVQTFMYVVVKKRNVRTRINSQKVVRRWFGRQTCFFAYFASTGFVKEIQDAI